MPRKGLGQGGGVRGWTKKEREGMHGGGGEGARGSFAGLLSRLSFCLLAESIVTAISLSLLATPAK